MSYRSIIDNFSVTYDGIIGIYLHDAGQIIPLVQRNPKGLIIIRQNLQALKETGEPSLTYSDLTFGAMVSSASDKTQIILLVTDDKYVNVSKQWKRVLPALLKVLPISEIVAEESPSTKIARIITSINEILDEIILSITNQTNNNND